MFWLYAWMNTPGSQSESHRGRFQNVISDPSDVKPPWEIQERNRTESAVEGLKLFGAPHEPLFVCIVETLWPNVLESVPQEPLYAPEVRYRNDPTKEENCMS